MEYLNSAIKVVKKGRDMAMRRSPTEILVRESTSNETVPPSGQQMRQIADLTYSFQEYVEIMRTLWERIEDDGKNWRHVYKGLLVLDYLLKNGSDRVIQECRARILAIKTLSEFQHIDDDSKDVGASIRARAKAIVELLHDDKRLEAERKNASATRDRYGAAMSSDGSHYRSGGGGGGSMSGFGSSPRGRDDWGRREDSYSGYSNRRDDYDSGRRRDDYDDRHKDYDGSPASGRRDRDEGDVATTKPRRPSGSASTSPKPSASPVVSKPAPNLIDDEFFNPAPAARQAAAEEDFFNPRAAPAPTPAVAAPPAAAVGFNEDFFAPRPAAPTAAPAPTMMAQPVAAPAPVRHEDEFTEFAGARSGATSTGGPAVHMQPLVPQALNKPQAQSTATPSPDSKDPWNKKNLFDLDSLKISSTPAPAPQVNRPAGGAPSSAFAGTTTSGGSLFSSASNTGSFASQPSMMGQPSMGMMGQPMMMGQPAVMGQPMGQPMMMGQPAMMAQPGMMGQPMMMGQPGMMGQPMMMGQPAMMGQPGMMMGGTYGQPGMMGANPNAPRPGQPGNLLF